MSVYWRLQTSMSVFLSSSMTLDYLTSRWIIFTFPCSSGVCLILVGLAPPAGIGETLPFYSVSLLFSLCISFGLSPHVFSWLSVSLLFWAFVLMFVFFFSVLCGCFQFVLIKLVYFLIPEWVHRWFPNTHTRAVTESLVARFSPYIFIVSDSILYKQWPQNYKT